MTLRTLNHYINGQGRKPPSGDYVEVRNPLDDSPYGQVARGVAADVDAAVAAAQAAFRNYRVSPPGAREEMLLAAADVLKRDADRFVDILVDEVGSPINKARFEVKYGIECLRAAAGIPRRTSGQTIPTDMPGRVSMSFRAPLGVVGAILPFNVPLIKGVKLTCSPLSFGNTVVCLPTHEAPSIAFALADVYAEAGFPAGSFNVVGGIGEEIGDCLTGHEQVRAVLFTGSLRVGRHISGICGKHMKPCILELGGKSPLVVLDDADVDAAVKAAAMGCFFFQGQGCMVASRILVQEGVREEFTEKLKTTAEAFAGMMGDLRDPATMVGPIIHERQRRKIRHHIGQARELGATVIAGGGWHNNHVEPTVLTGVTEQMDVCREETFGPVTSIYPIADLDQAIDLANDTNYGLAAAIFTRDVNQAMRFVSEVESGMVHVNAPTFADEPHVPFGGVKDSGFGREGTEIDADVLTEWKWATIQLPVTDAQFGPSAK
ncbi:MAG: aldehyde dehydrogenase family protein [Pseudomonadota bacterium]